MPMARDLAAVESGRAQQAWNRVAEVSGHMAVAQHPPRRQAVAGGHIAADVDEMQPAAGPEHAKNFRSSGGFRVVGKMMQHHRRQYAVEFGGRVGQLLGVALVKADAAEPLRFSVRLRQRPRVGVAADKLDAGMSTLGADRDVAGPATDFQNTLTAVEFGLRDEGVVDLGHAEQPRDEVVTGKEDVAAGGGQVVVVVAQESM